MERIDTSPSAHELNATGREPLSDCGSEGKPWTPPPCEQGISVENGDEDASSDTERRTRTPFERRGEAEPDVVGHKVPKVTSLGTSCAADWTAGTCGTKRSLSPHPLRGRP
jgi:hypothetical protein